MGDPMSGNEARAEGLRLNLGCGSVHPQGWVNVDASLGARLAQVPLLGRVLARWLGLRIAWSPDIVVHDLRRPFPWPDASAAVVYSSHTLEHLTRDDGRRFLAECARVLAPGGVMRIVVPDVSLVLAGLEKGRFPADELLDRLGTGFEEPGDGPWRRRLAPLFRHPHRCMYDGPSLLQAFEDAGLAGARLHTPELSRIQGLDAVELPERARGSVIVEVQKPTAAG